MKATFVKNGVGPSPEEWFKGVVKNIERGAQEGLDEVSESGETLIKGFITSRGARTSGPRGRYETGAMFNSVAGRTAPGVSNFGWINGMKPYFLFQEGGFRHVNSGEWVQGMYAVSDSADITFEWFKAHMDKVVRDA